MNIAHRLALRAAETPNKPAIIFSEKQLKDGGYHYSKLSFKELEDLSNHFAYKLNVKGSSLPLTLVSSRQIGTVLIDE
jgi:acyl-CoA synthetase (AMP-forming)/AMP-acid ligase II